MNTAESVKTWVAAIIFFVIMALPIIVGARFLSKAVGIWRNDMLERYLDTEYYNGKMD